jgi:hypothetical protein
MQVPEMMAAQADLSIQMKAELKASGRRAGLGVVAATVT